VFKGGFVKRHAAKPLKIPRKGGGDKRRKEGRLERKKLARVVGESGWWGTTRKKDGAELEVRGPLMAKKNERARSCRRAQVNSKTQGYTLWNDRRFRSGTGGGINRPALPLAINLTKQDRPREGGEEKGLPETSEKNKKRD